MPSFLADHNIEGHFRLIFDQIRGPYWSRLAEVAGFLDFTFADLGFDRRANDRQVWRECQRSGMVLITGNRNADGPDSLENIIRAEAKSDSLPVLTISDVDSIYHDRDYLNRVVERLVDYAIDLDRYRGAGRLYLP